MPMDYEGIGRRIAIYRKLNGLTAAALSERVEGLSRANLAKIETGKRDSLDIGMLLAIASALGVPHIALLLDISAPGGEVEFGPTVIQMMTFSSEGDDREAEAFRRQMTVAEALAWNSFEPMRLDLVTTDSPATEVAYGQVKTWRRYRRATIQYELAARDSDGDDDAAAMQLRFATQELWSAYKDLVAAKVNANPPNVRPPDDDESLLDEDKFESLLRAYRAIKPDRSRRPQGEADG